MKQLSFSYSFLSVEYDTQIINSALRRAVREIRNYSRENHSKDSTMHIIIAGYKYDTDMNNSKRSWTSMLDGFLHDWTIGNDCNSLMRTHIYMYRDLLISKEKMEQFCTGQCYRQFHHKTPTEEEFYEESINDDIDLMLEDIKFGRRPTVDLNWTYFLPELTSKELELVENKDKEYFKRFKWSSNPDVDEAEMKASKSSSKYVCAYCCRETLVFSDLIEQKIALLRQQKESLRQEKESLQQANEILQQYNESLQQADEFLQQDNESLQLVKESLRRENERLRQEKESLQRTSSSALEASNILIELLEEEIESLKESSFSGRIRLFLVNSASVAYV